MATTLDKLPDQVLVNEEQKSDRLKELMEQVASLEKELRRAKNSLAIIGKKERLQRDSRQYRMFLAVFDGLAAAGQFTPEELAKRGGMARVELLIKHSMGVAEHGLKYYREAKANLTGEPDTAEEEAAAAE